MMSSNPSKLTFVIPGDEIGAEPEFCTGNGTYAIDGVVRASLAGVVVIDCDRKGQRRANVSSNFDKAEDFVINIGDKVLCRVVRTNYNQAFVDILSVGDHMLPIANKGVIRREDISAGDLDKIVVQESFMGGDIVRASVLSLGDSKQYFLSTAEAGLGVQIRTAQRL